MLHGPGVVHGFEVTVDKEGVVSVAPGFALDPHGREIEVCEPGQLAIPDGVDPVSICLMYAEVETDRGTVRETDELTAATVVPERPLVLAVLEGGVVRDARSCSCGIATR